MMQTNIDSFVVGVSSVSELHEILRTYFELTQEGIQLYSSFDGWNKIPKLILACGCHRSSPAKVDEISKY